MVHSGGHADLDTFSALLGSVYESATDPEHWSVFLRGLAGALNAKSGMFRVIDQRGPAIRANIHYNLDPEFQRPYCEYFVHRDTYLAALLDQPAGFVAPGEALLDQRALRRTEYFADYLAPQCSYYSCGGLAMRNEEFLIKFGLQRERATGPFSEDDAAFLRRFVPHIQRAARLGHLLGLADQQQVTAEHALESLGVGVVLLDEARRILHTNSKAERVLERGCGVTSSDGRLAVVQSGNAARLRDLLAIALTRAGIDAPPVPETMLLTPGDGDPQLLLVACPVPPTCSTYHGPWPRASVAVFISNLAAAGLLNHEVLVTLYGLTASEARLACALSRGHDLADLGREWGLSRETLRTHLKRALHKTGTHRQAELVRLLAGSPWNLMAGAATSAEHTDPDAAVVRAQ